MSSPTAANANEMQNAEIFTQNDVIAYLERKGLSAETIKRLQICDNSNTNTNAKSNNIRKIRKSKSVSKHHKNIKLPSVERKNENCTNNSPRFHRQKYKKNQKQKRLKMIQNYSDAELLKLLNKKRKRRKDGTHKKRNANSNKFYVDSKNKLSTNAPNMPMPMPKREFQKSKQKKKSEKLAQLRKYYSLKLNGIQYSKDSHQRSNRNHQKIKKSKSNKKRSLPQSKSHRALIRHKSKSKSMKSNNVSNSTDLLAIMEQILGKDRKHEIEEYYKQLYSHNERQMIQPINIAKLPQIINNSENETKNENEMSEYSIPKPEKNKSKKNKSEIIAAFEPEITNFVSFELSEFEIEPYLEMGQNTQINLFLFTNKHNINIIPNNHSKESNEIELNLPNFEKMTYFADISHMAEIAQSKSYLPCVLAIETIEVDPKDWSKILENKTKPTKTSQASTAVLPLFVPREQCAIEYIETDLKTQSTNAVSKDELQRLSAPEVHRMNGPPLYQHLQQTTKGESKEIETEIITESNSDEMISNLKSEENEIIKNMIPKTSILNAPNSAVISAKKEMIKNSESLIGNDPLTQGARNNQTSIGTALLSVKMSGLKQRLTPSQTATASIDPYNTNEVHSKLISTNAFGPNVVTQARPITNTQIIPRVSVSSQNTQTYQFQSANPNTQTPYVMIPTPINNGMYPMPMYYPPQMYPYSPMYNSHFMNGNGNGNGRNNNIDISEDTNRSVQRSTKRGERKRKAKNSNKRGKSRENGSEIKDLFTKAINNRHSSVEEMLASNTDPNTKDEHGNTILHIAAQNGNKRLIKIALRWGAHINEQNKQGQTALHYLFAYKYENLAAYVISKGADDTVQNEFGYTCYDGLRPSEE